MSNRYKMFILPVWVELGFCATIFVTLVMITVFEKVSFKKKKIPEKIPIWKKIGKKIREKFFRFPDFFLFLRKYLIEKALITT